MSSKIKYLSRLSLQEFKTVFSKITAFHFIIFGLLITLHQGLLIKQSHASTSNTNITTLLPTDDRNTRTLGNSEIIQVHTYEHGFLRFDISQLSQINTATLRLFANNPDDTDSAEVRLGLANTDNWTETAATPKKIWDLVANGSKHLASVALPDDGVGWVELDVTELIRNELINDGLITFEFGVFEGRSSWWEFSSKEGANPPELIIDSDQPGNQSPVANFIADQVMGSAPLTVQFDANTSTDDIGITNYHWDFGDGDSIENGDPRVDHTYISAGDYNVVLTVSDGQLQNSSSTQITVLGSGPQSDLVLKPTDDRSIRLSGDNPVMNVHTYEHAFIKFDLQEAGSFESATLRVFYDNADNPEQKELRVGAGRNDDWSEETGTPKKIWNLFIEDDLFFASEPTPEGGVGWIELDVTEFVTQQADLDQVVTFELGVFEGNSRWWQISSKEGLNPPELFLKSNSTTNGEVQFEFGVFNPVAAMASSFLDYSSVPENAIDRNTTSSWSSNPGDDEWIYVDLGEIYEVNEVQIDWGINYGQSISVQISNNTQDWNTLITTTNNIGSDSYIGFGSEQARYVRILGVESATNSGYTIKELQVIGQRPIGDNDNDGENDNEDADDDNDGIIDIEDITPYGTSTGENYGIIDAVSASSPSGMAVNSIDNDRMSSWEFNNFEGELLIDLGAIYTIDRVALHWGENFASGYELQYQADDGGWDDNAFISTGPFTGTVHDMRITSIETRFLRIVGIFSSDFDQLSLNEIDIFGILQAVNQ